MPGELTFMELHPQPSFHFLFCDMVSLSRLRWPGTHSVAQPVLEQGSFCLSFLSSCKYRSGGSGLEKTYFSKDFIHKAPNGAFMKG